MRVEIATLAIGKLAMTFTPTLILPPQGGGNSVGTGDGSLFQYYISSRFSPAVNLDILAWASSNILNLFTFINLIPSS